MGSLTWRHIHGRHRICTVNIMDFDYVNGMPSSTTRVFANTALILGFAFQVMGANYGMAWSIAAFPNGTPMVKAAILFAIFATIFGLLAIVPMIMGIVSSKRVVLVTGLAMLFQMIHMALVSADQGSSSLDSTLTRSTGDPQPIVVVQETFTDNDKVAACNAKLPKVPALSSPLHCEFNDNGDVLLMMTMTGRRRRAVDGADALALITKCNGAVKPLNTVCPSGTKWHVVPRSMTFTPATDNTWSLALGWLAFSALLLCTVLRIMEKRN